MRLFFRSILLVAAVAVFTGCGSMHHADEGAMITAAKTVDQKFVQSFNAGDAAAMADCYWKSDQTLLFPPDAMVVHGWDAIKQGYIAMVSQMKGARMELTESHYQATGHDVAAWGLWRITMPQGGPVMSGRFTELLGQRDGKWVYLIDHPSVPLPAH